MGFWPSRNGPSKLEKSVLPQGCRARVSADGRSVGTGYEATVHVACAGLVDGVVDVNTVHFLSTLYEKVRRRNDEVAIRQSAAQVLGACATCPLGPEGRLRRMAMRTEATEDDLGNLLQIAMLENDTAHTRQAAAAAELELLQRRQLQSPEPPVPPLGA